MQWMPAQRCVVVGVDGSPNSLAALRRAADEARRRHARLDVVRVLPPGPGAGPLRTFREWLRLRALVARRVGRSQHLTTRLLIAYGEPGRVLAERAAHGELLVIGARAHSEHGDPFGGATVPAVRHGARCEITICADHRASLGGDPG
ncbi:hypothetical protein GCM10023085_20700 [Actinomadura viridis]|uniref:Nucleotide-binding universal stress UspA family protein n=1 Tax=Actinomadura viridis TaxID=58110 RepID=A0A931DIF1_9ACTN|nr:universal stress protein [Actinomadura viridis]MBG6089173.1 nucleotide-binding universal stress UspA family protein [Actinomadura viridis]